MALSPRLVRVAAGLLVCLVLVHGRSHVANSGARTYAGGLPTMLGTSITDKARASELIRRQPGFFVPNLGQWDHAANFVHRSGSMTLFLQDRGWVIDVAERPVQHAARPSPGHRGLRRDGEVEQKIRGVALQMTFEGAANLPEIVGEEKFAGHHNYFLGSDQSRWRTGVPLYGSVRYENLYPRIDLRLREMNGVPEYDLLLAPGADLSRVTVHVEGGQGLSIASDGALVIETALGPLTQSRPRTWQVDHVGSKREVTCDFKLLSATRYGFSVIGWDPATRLTIDPGLIWSTFIGGKSGDNANALSVAANGEVTVARLLLIPSPSRPPVAPTTGPTAA